MERRDFNRRDFNKLTAAAFGGILSGAAIGCGDSNESSQKVSAPGKSTDTGASTQTADVAGNPWTADKHVCRGLNACKGKGADGNNDCAGKGACATVEHQTCGGNNQCKFLGGCGADVAQNDCKGQGGCHVPLMDGAWKKARASFEAAMEKAKKPVGDPPPKSG